MSEYIQKIENMLANNNGIITANEVRSAGISPSYLSQMMWDGKVYRVGRGLYALYHVDVDEMYELFWGYKDIVFSHMSALWLHGLIDRTPSVMTVTVTCARNTRKLLETGLAEFKRSTKQTHSIGLTQMSSPSGYPIPVYNMERTVCDVVKAQNQIDPQVLRGALTRYAQREDKNPARLAQYAKALKAEELLREYGLL